MNFDDYRRAYVDTCVTQVPRLLSMIDKDRDSPTYGCFDRDYWHYKNIDFACARSQEAALTLALLYKFPFDEKYHNSKRIRDLAIAAMNYWSKIQNRDGSFDEWYAYEHSFVPTAFTTLTIAEAYQLLESEIDETQKKALLKSFEKAASSLFKNDDLEVVNHETGAIVTLHMLGDILKEKKYKDVTAKKLKLIFDHQTSEGWFYEYSGADIGYLTLSIEYLAMYYKLTNDSRVLDSIRDAVKFLSKFIHPDGTLGGDYASRNTQMIFPYGFEIVSEKIPLAERISRKLVKSIIERTYLPPFELDENFLCRDMYHFLLAYLEREKKESESPIEPLGHENQPFMDYFPISKLLAVNTGEYYAIVGGAKGGVLKAFSLKSNSHVLNDCGYIGLLKNGNFVTTSVLDPENIVTFEEKERKITIEGNFKKTRYHTQSPIKTAALRIVSFTTLGSSKVKDVLRKMLITSYPAVPITFSREITFKKEDIIIKDKVHTSRKTEFDNFHLTDRPSLMYSPYSDLFSESDLLPLQDAGKHSIIDTLERGQSLIIDRKINPVTGKIRTSIEMAGVAK